MKSEFGKGLCYCLGLFLSHAERNRHSGLEKYVGFELWFNAASDHLFDLQIDSAPKHLRKRMDRFRTKCIIFGHGFPKKTATLNDFAWAIQEAKDLLRLIDKANKVPTEKGDYE